MFNRDDSEVQSWVFIEIRQTFTFFSNPLPVAFEICRNDYRNDHLTIFDDPSDVENYIKEIKYRDACNVLMLALTCEMAMVFDMLNTKNYNDFYDATEEVTYYSPFSPPRYIPFLENNHEYADDVFEEPSELSFNPLPEDLYDQFRVAPPVEESLRKGKYEDSVELETYDLDDIEEFACVKVGDVYQIYKPEVLTHHIEGVGSQGSDLKPGQFRDINTNAPVYKKDVYTVSSDYLRNKYLSEENAPQEDEPAVRKNSRR